ncbi:MAG TPA: hypothetical protein VGM84_16355 [Steroidobacteraceae bacterium]
MQFAIVTQPATVPVCGAALLVPDSNPETSCAPSGDIWDRRSATAHELAKYTDGNLIRVVGLSTTPDTVLRSALDRARPMTDSEYNAVLFPMD